MSDIMYCCNSLKYYSILKCDLHQYPCECPDVLIHKQENLTGLYIHDGGSSFILINYCPWCGTKTNNIEFGDDDTN